ncbi:hypothetical protein B0H12DRAFT_1217130 [Mycena haematopus]|nr:hypothetical protein B0H12DRAFT_1217130 [Mycena haematopus]
MAAILFPMRAIVLEQKERTRKSSKADVERFIEESQLKIVSLESQIKALVELCNHERACVAALRHIISPIHTLPLELLAEIFELTIRDDYVHEDVFRISQVCSDWRQVAHSTPLLWTRPIRIDLELERSGREEVYMDGLKAWLVRSAPLTVPVSLVMEFRETHRVEDEVLRAASRYRSLHLIGPYTRLAFVRRLARARLDNLEDLDLGFLDEDVPTVLPSFTVPQLRKLSIYFCSNAVPILVPWAQLTDITLGANFRNIALDVLGQCPNLIGAAVITAASEVLPEITQDILGLSHLRFLSLSFFGWRHGIPFLDNLSTPVLEQLCLEFDMGVSYRCWTEARFTAFQLRAPSITQLDLKYSDLTSDDLRTAMRHAPSLTHLKLTLCHHCFDDALIEALYYGALVPNLHTLFLDHIGNNFTQGILVDMIASRWWTDAELASRLDPPMVSRWTSVQLRGGFDHQLLANILPSDVLGY